MIDQLLQNSHHTYKPKQYNNYHIAQYVEQTLYELFITFIQPHIRMLHFYLLHYRVKSLST